MANIKEASKKLEKFLGLYKFSELSEVLEEALEAYVIGDNSPMSPRTAITNFLEWHDDYDYGSVIVYKHKSGTDFYIPYSENQIAYEVKFALEDGK